MVTTIKSMPIIYNHILKYKMRHNSAGFTLIEVLMTVTITAFMFAAVNSLLISSVKKHMLNSYSEHQQEQAFRACSEISSFTRHASVAIIIGTGAAPATKGNTLKAYDTNHNQMAAVSYATNSLGYGNLTITVGGSSYTYSPYILPMNISGFDGTNIFNFDTNTGLVNYGFLLVTPTATNSYYGVSKPLNIQTK
jgi:prepilin-type N-terminal cleavage/methylation domain-containing protein